jgi:YidC/Oxa1 family membrane protein insertase
VDRNAITASILIGLILVVWMTWLSPEPPPQNEPVPADGTEQLGEVGQADARTTAPGEELPFADEDPTTVLPGVSSDSLLAAAQTGEEREIVVQNDLYTATFSTKGATLTGFELRTYTKFDQETPVEIVSQEEAGALGLLFTTARSANLDTRTLYFEPVGGMPGDTIRVGEGGATLAFEAQLGDGVLRQTYTFAPETYEVGLDVAATGTALMTRDGYELFWDGGLPFSEGDPEDEALRSGAFARSGGELEGVELNGDLEGYERLSGLVDWVAVKDKYFTAVVMPSEETRGAELEGEAYGGEGTGLPVWENFEARLLMPALDAAHSYRLYIGPMEYGRISDYDLGLYDMVDLGWDFFEIITRPLARFIFVPAFTYLGAVLPNYGLAIIALAFLIKLVLFPLTRSSYRSMAKMRELAPKMQEIKEEYPDDPQKQQAAMMKMYKETGANPIGGCVPMLLQYPIIIALWQYLPQSIQIRQQGFLWANDLSAPDVILDLPFTIPFYGDFVAGFTVLMGLSMVVQMKIQMTPQATSNPQMKIMMYVFPIMIFVIFNRFASGLSLYYLCYNVFTAIQQVFINKEIHAEQEKKEAEAPPAKVEKLGKGGKPQRAKKVSTNGKSRKSKGPAKAKR